LLLRCTGASKRIDRIIGSCDKLLGTSHVDQHFERVGYTMKIVPLLFLSHEHSLLDRRAATVLVAHPTAVTSSKINRHYFALSFLR
jgi:hypothetical protein